MIPQRYVINGWYTDGDGEFFCDDCGYMEGRGHATDCPRYDPKEIIEEDEEDED